MLNSSRKFYIIPILVLLIPITVYGQTALPQVPTFTMTNDGTTVTLQITNNDSTVTANYVQRSGDQANWYTVYGPISNNGQFSEPYSNISNAMPNVWYRVVAYNSNGHTNSGFQQALFPSSHSTNPPSPNPGFVSQNMTYRNIFMYYNLTNSKIFECFYHAHDVPGPLNLIVHCSYTVPAGKIGIILNANAQVWRQSQAQTAGYAETKYRIDGAQHAITAFDMDNNIVGEGNSASLPTTAILFSGETLELTTQDSSIGGGMLYEGDAEILEIDIPK